MNALWFHLYKSRHQRCKRLPELNDNVRSSREIQTYINKVIIIGVCAHMLDDHIREAQSSDPVWSSHSLQCPWQ
jgi:hypothetical protein